jgi:lactoylglutathione lyase
MNDASADTNLQLTVPFFMVSDMETSLNFYTKGLGFKIANTWTPNGKIEWCWLQRESVAFMLQQPHNKDSFIEDKKTGAGVSICIQCKDALALYHEFKKNNIEMKEPFVGNNMWVVSLTDPDGYRIEFESNTDTPEETKYSDIFKRDFNN